MLRIEEDPTDLGDLNLAALQAPPVGSIIRTDMAVCAQKSWNATEDDDGMRDYWYVAGSEDEVESADLAEQSPIRLLYRGSEG